MTRPLKFRFEAEGSEQVERALRELNKRLKSLEGTQKDVEKNTKQAATAAKQQTDQITQLSKAVDIQIQRFRNLVENLKAGFDRFKALADEMERRRGIFNRFTGDITEAAERTNGLHSELTLMTAQMKLTEVGLHTTGREFANIVVKVTEFAAATGQDATAELERFTEALGQGESGGLRRYGIALDGVTDRAEVQRLALQQLELTHGDVVSSADTLTGRLDVLANAMDDASNDFINGTNQTDAFARSLNDIEAAVGPALAGITDLRVNGFNSLEIAGAATVNVIAGLVTETIRFAELAADAVLLLNPVELALNPEDAARRIRDIADNIGDIGSSVVARTTGRGSSLGSDLAAAAAERDQGPLLGNTVGPFPPRRSRSGGGGNREAERQAELDRQNDIGRGRMLFDQILGERTDLQSGDGSEEETVEEFIFRHQEEIVAANTKLVDLQSERLRLLGEEKAERDDILAKIREEQEETNLLGEILDAQFVTTRDVGNLLIDVFQRGPVEALDAFAEAFSEKMLLLALEEAAQAIAAAASFNYAGAAQHAAAAVAFGAAAAAAGGVAAAIDSGPAAPPGNVEASPTNVGAGGGDGGSTTVINFNAPTTDALIGEQMLASQRAAQRRGLAA